MVTRTTKHQLLAGTSALAIVAAVSIYSTPAQAALAAVHTLGNTTAQVAGADSQTATIGDGASSSNDGNITVAGAVISTGAHLTENVLVENVGSANWGVGITGTGAGNDAVTTGGLAGSFANITVGNSSTTGGTISSQSTNASGGTIVLDGSVDSATAINTGINGTITNSGAGGNAIFIGANSNQTGTITNAGTISETGGSSAIGIDIASHTGNVVNIVNTGLITVTGGTAINTGANSVVHITQTSGTITGAIVMGTTTGSSLAVNGGIVAGNVTMGQSGQSITLAGGQINGTIDGAGVITQNTASYTANGAIGAGTAITKLIVNDSDAFSTTGAIKTTGGIILGSGAVGSTITVGAGVITGGIQGSTGNAGTGTVNFTNNQTLGAGGVGSTTQLATINITDSKVVDDSANATGLSAAHIYLGTSTAGATLEVGTGAVTSSAIDSKANDTGTLIFTGANTVGGGTTIGNTNTLHLVQINDGVAVSDTVGVIKATTVQLGSTTTDNNTKITLGTNVVTGAITTLVNDKGIVNIGGTQTIGGNIGTSSLAIHNLNINAGTTSIGTNSVFVGSTGILSLASGASLNLTTGQVTGNIGGDADTHGTVNFAGTYTTAGSIGTAANLAAVNLNSGANVTLGAVAGDNIQANLTTVNTGAALHFGDTAHVNAGDLTGAGTGTIDIGSQVQHLNAGTSVGTGAFTTAVGGETVGVTINSGVNNASGNLNIAGVATIDAATKIAVNITSATGYIGTGAHYNWLTTTGAGNNGSANLVGGHITDNDQYVTFAESGGAGATANRVLTATRTQTYATLSNTVNDAAAGTALEGIGALIVAGTVTDASLKAAVGLLEADSSSATLNASLKELTPQVNGTSVQAIADTGESLNVVDTRLEELRAGNDISSNGMAAGGKVADRGLWFQAFGTTGTQDLRQGVDGYDVRTGGGAVGADMAVGDKTRAGLSLSYAKSTIDSNGSANQDTGIDSYQGNLYGSYNMGQWYVDGLAGFAYQDYSSTRVITGVGTADGSFQGETYTARANTGYRMQAGHGIDVTPNAGLTYYYNHVGSYTETGVGGAGLNVGSTNAQALIGRLGADFGYDMHSGSTLIRPVLRAGYSYDFIGDQVGTTSSFTGGGATFRTKDASPERNAWNLGASLNIVRSNNVTFSADYDYEGKSGYDSHSGVLRARMNF